MWWMSGVHECNTFLWIRIIQQDSTFQTQGQGIMAPGLENSAWHYYSTMLSQRNTGGRRCSCLSWGKCSRGPPRKLLRATKHFKPEMLDLKLSCLLFFFFGNWREISCKYWNVDKCHAVLKKHCYAYPSCQALTHTHSDLYDTNGASPQHTNNTDFLLDTVTLHIFNSGFPESKQTVILFFCSVSAMLHCCVF